MRIEYTYIALMLCLLCASCHDNEAVKKEAVQVETIAVKPSMVSGMRIYSGSIEESEGMDVAFSVAGMMDSVWVKEGDFVQKGQAIGQINSRGLQSTLQSATAEREQAEAQYEQKKEQRDAHKLSDLLWAQAETSLRKAKSDEALAKKAVEDATLRAPFSGYVSRRYADAGSVVAPSAPVIKLCNIDEAHIAIAVPAEEIANLSIGDSAYVTVSVTGQKRLVGNVVERSSSIDPSTGKYAVRIEVDNDDYRMRPGMQCNVEINSGSTEMGIVIPQQFIITDANNGRYVWIAYHGKAVKRAVEISGVTEGGMIIANGISAGDSIITKDHHKISEFTQIAYR